MAGPEKTIAEAVGRLQKPRREVVGQALAEYFLHMPQRRFPRRDELDAAEQRARVCLRRGMWQRQWLAGLMGESAEDEGRVEALKLAFITQTHPLECPLPAATNELPPRMLGYAAAIGAVLGLLSVMVLSRLFTGHVRVDLAFIGAAPLGAFAMVLFIGWISRHGRLRRMLQAALGVATIVEVWMAVTGTANPLRAVWRRMGGQHPRWGLVRRLLTYIFVIMLLQLSVRRPTYYRDDHEKAVRSAVNQWLDGALRLQAAMCIAAQAIPPGPEGNDKLAGLAKHLYTLHDSTREELPVSAAALLQEARNVGFERLGGEPAFMGGEAAPRELVWRPEMHRLYETFGRVEAGDPVRIEREAVVQEGKVLHRGLVRRERKGARK